MNKILYLFIVLFSFASNIHAQPEWKSTYRGYGTIDYIGVLVEDNKIISEKDIKTIVKSIGIRTLPDNIYFDSEKYKATHSIEEYWQIYQKPDIYININTIRDKVEPNKYSGNIRVTLRGAAHSDFIESRTADSFIDNLDISIDKKNEMKNRWKKKLANDDLISKSRVFVFATKSQIKNILREQIQEIFDELNILIRDYP